MNERLTRLAAELCSHGEDELFFEHILLLEEAEPLFEREPPALRYALTLAYVLDNMSVAIRPGERIVGHMPQLLPDAAQEAAFRALSLKKTISSRPLQALIHWVLSKSAIRTSATARSIFAPTGTLFRTFPAFCALAMRAFWPRRKRDSPSPGRHRRSGSSGAPA